MRSAWVGALLGALVLGVLSAPGDAASLMLSEADKDRAITLGQRSVTEETWGGEWRVRNGEGDTVTVMTPFYRVALAAREAAFKNEPLKPDEPEKILKDTKDRLALWVSLRGQREDFARFYAPRLIVGDREIEPAFVQNERTALREGGAPYVARCVYGFPTKDLTGAEQVILVIRDADRRDVSRFTIDLSKMR